MQFKRGKKRLNHDLSVSDKRLKSRAHLVRALEQHQLDAMRGALGSAFAVGVTKPIPTLKKIDSGVATDTAHTNDHDKVRIVTCKKGDIDTNPNKDEIPVPVLSSDTMEEVCIDQESIERKKVAKRRTHPGIEMEFVASETGLTDLHWNAMFKKHSGKSDTVRRAQRGGKLVGANAGSMDTGVTKLNLGNMLKKDGAVHTVSSASKDGKRVHCARTGHESDGTAMSLGHREAMTVCNEWLQF